MLFKHRMLYLLASAVLLTGCGNKASEPVPATAPAVAREPSEILKNLQYLGLQKDFKSLQALSVSDTSVAYAAACRLHRQAGDLGIVLRDQDIMDLGVTDLRTKGYLVPGVAHSDLVEAKAKNKLMPWMAKLDAQKLDRLPESETLPNGRPNSEYQELRDHYALPALQTGIYRLVSGVPAAMWPKLEVLGTRPDPKSTDVQDVSIGYKGKPVLEVAVLKSKTGTWGVCNLVLQGAPRQLTAMLEGNN